MIAIAIGLLVFLLFGWVAIAVAAVFGIIIFWLVVVISLFVFIKIAMDNSEVKKRSEEYFRETLPSEDYLKLKEMIKLKTPYTACLGVAAIGFITFGTSVIGCFFPHIVNISTMGLLAIIGVAITVAGVVYTYKFYKRISATNMWFFNKHKFAAYNYVSHYLSLPLGVRERQRRQR